MGDVEQTAEVEKPPHPGSAWQQLFDHNTGYPYYWNVHNNQVRWDVPPEFVQYQQTQRQVQAKKAAEVARNPTKPENNGIAALVSAYSDDSDDEKGEEPVEEVGDVKKVEDEESKPDFIGPVKPSTESDDEKEVQTNEEEPAPPGENDEDELSLLRKLQEKSAALAKMGGDISKEVKEIIDPEHLAKIEEDIADDIMSQIEAEEPPDYKAEEDVSAPKVPSPPLPQDEPPPDNPPLPSGPPLPPSHLPPGPPEEPIPSSNSISLLSCSYGGESEDEGDEVIPEEEPKINKTKGHILPPKENLGNIFYKAGASNFQTEEQKAALESFYVETAIENLKNDKEKTKVEKIEVGRGRKRRLEIPTGRFNKLEQGPEPEVKEQKVADPKFTAMPFVKSSSVLPGTINEPPNETVSDSNEQVIGVIDRGSPTETCEVAKEKLTNGQVDSRDADISNIAEELVDKLECFKVGQEKISSLKMLAVKIETLYGAWTAGALTPQYLTAVLTTVASSLTQAETSLNRPPWTAIWDRYEAFFISDPTT